MKNLTHQNVQKPQALRPMAPADAKKAVGGLILLRIGDRNGSGEWSFGVRGGGASIGYRLNF